MNRAYYSMFYAVLALLATRRTETSRHSGVLALFDRDFVKAGVLGRDLSRWLHVAFDARQNADYGEEFSPTPSQVHELVAHAREFLASIATYLRHGTP